MIDGWDILVAFSVLVRFSPFALLEKYLSYPITICFIIPMGIGSTALIHFVYSSPEAQSPDNSGLYHIHFISTMSVSASI